MKHSRSVLLVAALIGYSSSTCESALAQCSPCAGYTFTLDRTFPAPSTNTVALGMGDDGFVWVQDQLIYRLDPLTGAVQQSFASSNFSADVDVEGGIVYGGAEPTIFRYDSGTGVALSNLTGPVTGGSRGLAFANGELYVSGVLTGFPGEVRLGRVDKNTGALLGSSSPPNLVASFGIGNIGPYVGYLVRSIEPLLDPDVTLNIVEPNSGALIHSEVLFQSTSFGLYSLGSDAGELFVTRRDLNEIHVYTFDFGPVNDDCAGAIALPTTFADTPYDATGATTDGLAAGTNCDYGPFGDEQNYNDIWFTYTPDVGGCTYISTYGLAGYDTRLTVYSGYACPDVPLNIIACVDDEEPGAGPFEAGLDVDLTAGQTYTIRLGTYNAGTAAASGILRVAQGPGADIHSGGQNPGAPGCEVRRIPLNYNFNGIVHVGEAGLPDDPNGYRSVSDRALDFQGGVPVDGTTSKYFIVGEPGELDLVHLGNRNTVTGGLWAFDPTADGDFLGTQPAWLPSVDQSGPQTTVLPAPITLFPGASATILVQGTDGGGAFEVTLDFLGGGSATFTPVADDWFGGPYSSVLRDNATATTDSLNITENFFNLAPIAGVAITQITFENAANTNGAIAIIAMNINTGEPTRPANDDCADAIALPSFFADTPYDPSGATTDGSDALGFCDYGAFGDELNHKDIWFTYTPALGGCTYISTFGLAGYDTRLTVYDSPNCPDDPASIIACVDEELLPPVSPYEAGLDVKLVTGQTYLIRVGTHGENSALTSGTLRIAQGTGAAMNSGGQNPGAPGCGDYLDSCNGDGGNQLGCTNCPCSNNAPLGTTGGCLNSAASSGRLIASGNASISLPSGSSADLRFGGSGFPASAFCILNSGDGVAPGNMANPCFGLNSGAQSAQFDGLRCAITNTRRHGGRSADMNGEVGVTNSPWGGEGGPPVGLAIAGGGFLAGQTRYFQVINRDDPLAQCMRGLNTSQAVRVIFQP